MKSGLDPADLRSMAHGTTRGGGLTLTGTPRAATSTGTKRGAGAARSIAAGEPMQIERRVADRARVSGQGTGTFVDPDGRLWLARVTLVDRSDSGMGVRCPVPVASGARFHLSIDGAVSPIEGVVAHAKGRGGGYRLGLRCARRMAA